MGKQEKGITLIALVITIVVLLILVSVTIGVMKESDIIKHATDAKNKHVIAQEKEQIKLAYDSYKISKYIPIERSKEQDELETYFVGKILTSLISEDKSTDAYLVVDNYDGSEIIIPRSSDNVVIEEENIYVYFEHNSYNYIVTADYDTSEIKSIELDKDNITIPLNVAGAEVKGNEETGWGITFNDTNNKYTLNTDGTIEDKEFDNWTIAWVSDGTTWSTTEYTNGEEITEEYTIIAKLYERDEMAAPVSGGLSMPMGKTYSLKIEGSGIMPSIEDSTNKVTFAWLTGMYQTSTDKPNIYMYITDIEISEGIENIPYSAFIFGISLKEVKLPTTLKSIEKGAFAYCSSLEKFVVPNKVTKLMKETFYACMNLSEVTIPESVTTIESGTFSECRNLKTIYYNGIATGAPWGARNATVQTY